MTDEQLIDLAEYYRERHNEICQDDFIIEKPDYYNSKGKLIKYKEIKDDWSNVRLTVYNRNGNKNSNNGCCDNFLLLFYEWV